MTIIQAMLYGLVQGVAEFLPISSTAHLTLLPWLLRWSDPGVTFDVAVHLGTAAAVILFFFRDWILLFKAGFSHPKSSDGRLFWLIVLATIPGGIVGVLLDKYMENFRDPALIALMLIVMGVALYITDRFCGSKTELKDLDVKTSLGIGLSQVLAVIPGVSRSGVTITTGRLFGITREGIARFTFLMSAPIILADALFHMPGMVAAPVDPLPFSAAIITSGVVGILVIRFLLDYLKRHGFAVFAAYRLLLGAIVLIVYFSRG